MSSGICLRSKAEFHEKNCYVSAASESVHAFSFAAIYNYLRVISFPVIKSFTEINTPLSAVGMNGTQKKNKERKAVNHFSSSTKQNKSHPKILQNPCWVWRSSCSGAGGSSRWRNPSSPQAAQCSTARTLLLPSSGFGSCSFYLHLFIVASGVDRALLDVCIQFLTLPSPRHVFFFL